MPSQKTTFQVSITVWGEPKQALERLQRFLDGILGTLYIRTYTTETYSVDNEEPKDAAELMK